MSEELRELREYEEMNDVSDGIILRIIGRLAQAVVGVGSAVYTLHSYAEKGMSAETIIGAIGVIGAPMLIEWLLREDEQNIHDMYHEPGVVED